MGFRQSYTKPRATYEPTTFAGKFGLKKIAGLKEVGDTCFVIPLDTVRGFMNLPCHTLKANGDEGFKGSKWNSKIVCHSINPETGEPMEEEALCCKLARLEKERFPEQDDSTKRAITFRSSRTVIPVLVLGTKPSPEGNTKPHITRLSLTGIDFSFIDMAESTYDESIVSNIITQKTNNGEIEDADGMDQEELLSLVLEQLQTSLIKITCEKGNFKNPTKSYSIVPLTNTLIGSKSGETETISWLVKFLAGKIPGAKLEAFYKKFPMIKDINNQVIDFISLFDQQVDSLCSEWEEEELEEYYNKFVKKQDKVEEYKERDAKARAAEEEEEEVSFNKPAKKASKAVEEDFEDEDNFEEDFEAPAKPAKAKAKAQPAEEEFEEETDFSTADLEESSALDDVAFDEDDFQMDEDDFEG